MYDQVIKLLNKSDKINEYGDIIETFAQREIFAELKSISQSEFYQAQAIGMKPEIKFTIADYLDYQGEGVLEYESESYSVIRTFRKGNELEITCKRGIE